MIFRITFLVLVVLPFTLLGLPVQLGLLATGSRFWPVLPRIFFRLLARGLGLSITRVGAPLAGRTVLIVSNHISWLDIIAIAASMNVTFVAKADVARWPMVGFLAALAKTIFVDRTRRTATGATHGQMARRLSEGGAVLLFAEGTSDVGLRVLPFRSALMGAASAALDTGTAQDIPIQPMAIAYTALDGLPIGHNQRARVAWVGDMGLGDNLGAILSTGRIDITLSLAPPLPAGLDRKQAARHAQDQVGAMLLAANRGVMPQGFALDQPSV